MRTQQRKKYSSDLSDEEWKIIEPHVPKSQSNKMIGGAPEKYTKREVVNAILYVKTNGAKWKDIPGDLPPTGIVYHYFRVWTEKNLWEKINTRLVKNVRKSIGRSNTPSAAVTDGQSVKNTAIATNSGYDAGKKVKGVKRHIMTDTLGLLLYASVTPANIQDREAAEQSVLHMRTYWNSVKTIFADQGYTGKLVTFAKQFFNKTFEIVKKTKQHTFEVLPKRWVVERTFSWFEQARRLSKNFEHKHLHAEAFVYIASIHLLVKRIGLTRQH